ncbi:recombinase family protein [Burkholderia ubonensis]|uniref:recombinase family protein n=1 Tax=Burkholderia ubonensis TaxID=101571 RepID=UPI0009B338C3|nr:recombinase family protein [Burkholderia ubonensis]
MRIGYARVSTEEQNLDLQLIALEAAGCDRVITDHGMSGARFDRPGLGEVLALAQSDDTIVVWRLDRLGRSLSHLVEMMNNFRARGIHFASLNESINTGTSAGMFMFHMIAALAEFERGLIGERTRAGVAAARSRGQRLGRPPRLNRHQIEQARELLSSLPEADVADHFHVQRRTLRRLVRGLAARPIPLVSATVATDRDEVERPRTH